MAQHVLVIEDEYKIAMLHHDYLIAAGYQVTCLEEGTGAVEWVSDNKPDLILLDLMLPGKDGLAICKEVRQFTNVPIIMVTAKVDEIDRIIGLEVGADDYICKPFSPREVVARVAAVLRRQEPKYFNQAKQLISLDEATLTATIESKTMELTVVEFQLLSTMVKNPGKIFSRANLKHSIYSDHRVVSERTIDSHIKKLRKKIDEIYSDCDCIHSVYGAGYKFELTDKL